MLNLKAIRQNPDDFKHRLGRKGVAAQVLDDLLAADVTYREWLQKAEEAKQAQNKASAQIPQLAGEKKAAVLAEMKTISCLLYTSPSPRDLSTSRMPSSA